MIGLAPCPVCGGDMGPFGHDCAKGLAKREPLSDGEEMPVAQHPLSTPAPRPGMAQSPRSADGARVRADDQRRARGRALFGSSAGQQFDLIDRLIRFRIDGQWNRQKHERVIVDKMRQDWIDASADGARIGVLVAVRHALAIARRELAAALASLRGRR